MHKKYHFDENYKKHDIRQFCFGTSYHITNIITLLFKKSLKRAHFDQIQLFDLCGSRFHGVRRANSRARHRAYYSGRLRVHDVIGGGKTPDKQCWLIMVGLIRLGS